VSQHPLCSDRSERTRAAAATPLLAILLFAFTSSTAWGAASLFVSMAHSPAPAKEGTSLMIEFKIKNQGNAPSNGGLVFKVSCANTLPQGPPCSFAATSKSLGVIQPGGEVNVGPFLTQAWKAGTFRFSTSIGGRVGRAEVKTFDLVVAAVKTKGPALGASQSQPPATTAPQAAPRDSAGTTVAANPSLPGNLKPVPKPDLTVDLDLPNNANDVLRATVRNLGSAASPATTVHVTCEKKCDQFPWQACTGWPKDQAVPALAAGSSKTLVFNQQLPAWPMYYCWNKFSAKVDPAGQISELNESNNLDGGTVSGPNQP